MNPSPTNQSKRRRRPISRKKKALFSLLLFCVVGPPTWLVMEVAYRWWIGIPVAGGYLEEDILRNQKVRPLEDPEVQKFLSQYRESNNSILFYEPRPGFSDEMYSVNSRGFRDHEYSIDKPSDTYRIVVLGDSIIWGHGLLLEDTFAKQLERMLNEVANRKIEVLNFGVSGYSTQQEVELYRVKASQYQPDLVIVGYCLNDYRESSWEKANLLRMYDTVFNKSYLYIHLRRFVRGWAYTTFGLYHEDSTVQFDLREQFRLLETLCGETDTQHAVVVFPALVNFNDYPFAVEHKRIVDALNGLSYEVLDLLDHFKPHDAETFLLNSDDRTHPNAQGTQIAADATMNLLLEKNLIASQKGTKGK